MFGGRMARSWQVQLCWLQTLTTTMNRTAFHPKECSISDCAACWCRNMCSSSLLIAVLLVVRPVGWKPHRTTMLFKCASCACDNSSCFWKAVDSPQPCCHSYQRRLPFVVRLWWGVTDVGILFKCQRHCTACIMHSCAGPDSWLICSFLGTLPTTQPTAYSCWIKSWWRDILYRS